MPFLEGVASIVTLALMPVACPICANVPEWWDIEDGGELCFKHAEELDPSGPSPLVEALLGLNEPGVDKSKQWRKINGIVNLVRGMG